MIQVKRQEEMTRLQWEILWKDIKIQTHAVIKDIRTAIDRKEYPKDYPRCWGAVLTATRAQLDLERIVEESNPKAGWKANPLPIIEKLIQAIAEIDEPELQGMPEELAILGRRMEVMISVSYMAEWEHYRVALEQEEMFRKRCYDKLQKMKEFLKKLKEEELTYPEKIQAVNEVDSEVRSEGQLLEDIDTWRTTVNFGPFFPQRETCAVSPSNDDPPRDQITSRNADRHQVDRKLVDTTQGDLDKVDCEQVLA
jgi:hypothetical protein